MDVSCVCICGGVGGCGCVRAWVRMCVGVKVCLCVCVCVKLLRVERLLRETELRHDPQGKRGPVINNGALAADLQLEEYTSNSHGIARKMAPPMLPR